MPSTTLLDYATGGQYTGIPVFPLGCFPVDAGPPTVDPTVKKSAIAFDVIAGEIIVDAAPSGTLNLAVVEGDIIRVN